MTHCFIQKNQIAGDRIILEKEAYNHLKNVLRMRVGEELTMSDSATVYHGKIEDYDGQRVIVRILESHPGENELSAQLILFQGMPKGDKMETILQKATELGAAEIVPVFMERSVVKVEEKKQEAKLLRYRSIVESAAEQSKRDRIPEVPEFLSFAEAVCRAKELDAVIVPYENARGIDEARKTLSSLPENGRIGIFVGPEGGFGEAEIRELEAIGAQMITLGKRILRTETAPLAILSVLMFQLEK